MFVLGVAPYGLWTLSTIGAPCHFDLEDYKCAICAAGEKVYVKFRFKFAVHEFLRVVDEVADI